MGTSKIFWLVIVIIEQFVTLEYHGSTQFNTESNLQESSGFTTINV